jgi:hypothetical protein
VSYARYFGRVLEQLEPLTLHVREPYPTFLRDFIRTMQDPNEERMLDASIIEYLQKRRLEVEALVKATDTFHRAAAQKLKHLGAALTPYLDEQTVFGGMSSGYPDLFDVLSYRVLVSESVTVQLNINISPDGWYFILRNHKGDQMVYRTALQDWLTGCAINWFVRYERPWRPGCSHDEPLPYTSDPVVIQERVVELLRQIHGPLGDAL